MQIIFAAPKEIVYRESVLIETDTVTINQVTDNYTSVIALLSFGNGKTKEIILWEGKDYEAIGQWTDEDVTNRLKELL